MQDGNAVTKQIALAKLRSYRKELEDAGITRVYIFGSVARGEAGPESDVDLLAEFDRGKRLTLLDVVGLEDRLSRLIGTRVDLVREGTLRPDVQEQVMSEAIRAF